ncbi:MAG: CinA family nicotinamide mononucleotide deamidase-related protein [Verrucomicrobiota bacterium]
MSKSPVVEVINFGDELLLGIRENSHLKYLGEQLSRFGQPIMRCSVITDDVAEIKQTFSAAWSRADIVITTGGLGPTADDLTRESIATALGAEMEFDPEIKAVIKARFDALGRIMAPHHERQCYKFKSGFVLPNDMGTAPGLVYQDEGKTLIMLPGPSHELTQMFERYAIPFLQKQDLLSEGQAFVQIRSCGLGESAAEELLQPLIRAHPQLGVAYCVHFGVVDIRFSARDNSLDYTALKGLAQEARALLREDFVCFGDCSIGQVVFHELRSMDRTLAVAESCTGGLLCDAFTNIPGASKVFLGGIVCYSNDVKVSQVGVPESIIEQHGAVSPECAVALASGVAEKLGADHGLSLTGYAGPGGGDPRSPVGTVHLGYHSPVGVWCKTVRYTGGRLDVKARAVTEALDWLRRKLRKYKIEEFLSAEAGN